MFIVKDALCDGTKWHIRDLPKNPAVDPYFPINQASIDLNSDGNNLRVDLKTFTPNFAHFEFQRETGPWKPCADSIAWTPHAGRNELRIRAVNAFGVAGPISVIQAESN
jgi:hypothetical protein